MNDASLALQDVVEAALRADAALIADVDGVLRLFTVSAPTGTPKPYLVIGEDQVVPDGLSEPSDEYYTRGHVWTLSDAGVEASRREAKTIAAHVRRILDAPLDVPGFHTSDWGFELAEHLTDKDGLTCHSVIDHRFHLDPA